MQQPIVSGIVGAHPHAKIIMQRWNEWGTTKQPNHVCVRYATTIESLPLRLSEMFVHDRSVYFVAPSLQHCCEELLDTVQSASKVNCIVNRSGILCGVTMVIDTDFDPEAIWQYCQTIV